MQTGTSSPTSEPILASWNSPDNSTWATFDRSVAACGQRRDLSGIGFVFSAEDGFCGVDLDNSIDPETGKLKPWASQLAARLNSYTEISPSGKGVKIFIGAQKPGQRCRQKLQRCSRAVLTAEEECAGSQSSRCEHGWRCIA